MATLLVLLKKELLQILRDRFMLRQIIAMPIVQLLILSSAATFEVKTARVYLLDNDNTQISRGLVSSMEGSGRFRVTQSGRSMDAANEAMLHRRVDMILSIPTDFERDVVRARAAAVQLVFNAEDGAAAGVTQSYATRVIREYAAELNARLLPSIRAAPAVEVQARAWYNQQLDYRDYMVPGILVQLVTVIGTLLTAMNIVREKEIGTLEQLSVTPLARGTFIAAKLIPLWAIALVELTLGLIVAKVVFSVPMEGSLLLVFFSAGIYLAAALGIGLWVSTVAQTQQQAMFVTFFIIMIYLLMSGLFTPVRSMPEWAQWMAEINPVKHFIHIMRAVLLKGAGITDVARPLAFLAVIGAAVLSLAIRQYGRRSA